MRQIGGVKVSVLTWGGLNAVVSNAAKDELGTRYATKRAEDGNSHPKDEKKTFESVMRRTYSVQKSAEAIVL